MAGGRPPVPHDKRQEIVDKVCEYVMDMPLVQACDKAGVGKSTFFSWIVEDEGFSDQYARARKAISYNIDQEIDSITAAIENEEMKPDAARVILDAKKWLAGKRNPKVYGNNSDITSGGKAIKAPTIVVASEEDKETLEGITV